MKKHKQHIALAEVLNWTDCEYVGGLEDSKGLPPNDGTWFETQRIWDAEKRWLPQFTTDLNVAAKVERILTDRYWNYEPNALVPHLYLENLTKVVGSFTLSYAVVTATAAQRMEAILKALGLWEEDNTHE